VATVAAAGEAAATEAVAKEAVSAEAEVAGEVGESAEEAVEAWVV
jgi:hypothetical protein